MHLLVELTVSTTFFLFYPLPLTVFFTNFSAFARLPHFSNLAHLHCVRCIKCVLHNPPCFRPSPTSIHAGRVPRCHFFFLEGTTPATEQSDPRHRTSFLEKSYVFLFLSAPLCDTIVCSVSQHSRFFFFLFFFRSTNTGHI